MEPTAGTVDPRNPALRAALRVPAWSLAALIAALLGVTLADIPVRPPRSFLLHLAVGVVPFALACIWAFHVSAGLQRRTWYARTACIALGPVAVYFYPNLLAWWVLTAAALYKGAFRGTRWPWGPVGLQLAGLAAAYAALWLFQYLAASMVHGRLLDPALVAADLWVYRLLLGVGTSYQGIFPLVDQGLPFTLFERAYLVMFGEVFVAALVTAAAGTAVGNRFAGVLFGGYAVALLVFLVVPVVGPSIYRPDSFKEIFAATSTAQIMNSMAADFWRQGSELTGYGYFVGLPSMHVAVAVYLSQVLRRHAPALALFFLLPNVLLCASTVVLGYHYLLDVPAGIVLGLAMGRAYSRGLAAGAAGAIPPPPHARDTLAGDCPTG